MRENALTGLKGLLWFVALSHVLVGLGIMFSPAVHQFMAEVYGADVTWSPELVYLLRPMGAFMFGLGLLGIAAALNPLRHRVVIFAFVIVLLLRVGQRVIHREDIALAFDLSAGRQIVNGSFFFLVAIGLIVLTFAAGKERPAVDAAPQARGAEGSGVDG